MFGGGAGTLQARDSSPYGNNGTLTNFSWPNTATSGWQYVPELGRMGWVFDADDVLSFATYNYYSVSFWALLQPALYADCVKSGADTRIVRQLSDGRISFIYKSGGGYAEPAATAPTQLFHFTGIANPAGPAQIYINGSLAASSGSGPTTTATECSIRRFALLSDFTLHSRALTLPEIQILANRSDPSLGGLILPPRRVMFPSAAAPPSTITVTPDPVTATWSAVAPAVTKTVHVSPVAATWSIPTPTVRKITRPAPVAATWSVVAPVVTKTTMPAPVAASWTVVAPTVSKIIRPTPVAATWSIVQPTVNMGASSAAFFFRRYVIERYKR